MLLINPNNPDCNNLEITEDELKFIRSLEDFDLIMLLSEIHDNGWVHSKYPSIGGKALLPMIRDALEERKKSES